MGEIGEARQRATDILKQTVRIRDLKKSIDQKNKLLKTMARGLGDANGAVVQCVEMDEINVEWEGLMDGLSKHESTLEQQKARLAP